MTAPLVRDEAGRFTERLPYPPTPRDGFHLRHDPVVELARRELGEALAALRPAVTPCTLNPDGWYANGAAAVAKAIEACGRCPLIEPCDRVGRHEVWGVWAAVDRDQTRHAHRASLERQRAVPRAATTPRRVRRGRPLPVPCGWCGVGAGEVCQVRAGTASERNHAVRQRLAAA